MFGSGTTTQLWDETVSTTVTAEIVEHDIHGKESEVHYLGDMFHGRAVTWYENGKICQDICFISNEVTKDISYYENGITSRCGIWRDGKQTGQHIKYYSNGVMRFCQTYDSNGLPIGVWTNWALNGKTTTTNMSVNATNNNVSTRRR